MYFDELLTNDALLDALWDMHFDECTPIQERAIPEILDGKDIIGIAQTGTGKTAAYLLPVLESICNDEEESRSVRCIIIAPTRELARQIDQQLEGFSYYLPISSVAIYGGTDGITYERQRQALKKGADIVIATPGRLLAHLSMGPVDFADLDFLILDEADRMLDMGFANDINQIISFLDRTNANRQTLLFSATMPPAIRRLASTILKNPAEIRLAPSKPAEGIHQEVYYCDDTAKNNLLASIIAKSIAEGTEDEKAPFRAIIFSSSKLKVKELKNVLKDKFAKDPNIGKGITVEAMHSDLTQDERDETMLRFKSGRTNILVATDILARGIDIDDIRIVANYDVPHDPEDYVHRVGRTARAGASGAAVTLVSQRDSRKMKSILKLIKTNVVEHRLNDSKPDSSSADEKDGRKKNSRWRRHRKPAGKQAVAKGSENEPAEVAAPGNGTQPSAEKPAKHRRRRRNRHNKKHNENGEG